jgi:hypothetical protein
MNSFQHAEGRPAGRGFLRRGTGDKLPRANLQSSLSVEYSVFVWRDVLWESSFITILTQTPKEDAFVVFSCTSITHRAGGHPTFIVGQRQ